MVTTLLVIVFVGVCTSLAYRWRIATRGQRLADPPGPDPTPMPGQLPLAPRAQMDRAMRARGTHVVPQHVVQPNNPPTDGPR